VGGQVGGKVGGEVSGKDGGGGAETLADPYNGKIPLPRVDSFQEPFASRQDIQRKLQILGEPTNIWNA
jgi:hypothetical protein